MIAYEPVSHWFEVSGFRILPEPAAMNIAFAVFIIYIYFSMKKDDRNLRPGSFFWMVFTVILSSLFFGRLSYFLRHGMGFFSFFDLRDSGLISIGMIAGGIIGLLIYALIFRKKGAMLKDRIGDLGDKFALATALWIFLYRMLGCFFWGDVVGITSESLLWGVYWPATEVVRHPTALYLSFNGLAIFFLLRVLFQDKNKKSFFRKRFPGETGLWFLMLYCIGRFMIEFLRVGLWEYYGLNGVQWGCLASGSVVMLILLHAYYSNNYLVNKFKD